MTRYSPEFIVRTWMAVAILILLQPASAWAEDLTPAEEKLKQSLGERTPDPIRLWPGEPPRFVHDAPDEEVNDKPAIQKVSVPTITPYLPRDKRSGMAIIICPGGGYGSLDWRTHVVYAADVFNRLGVAVIGLKYRTRPPNGTTNEEIQGIALLDAQRAVRVVRQHAAEWKLDPNRIGIVGYSAGANLAMNLAANFDSGNAQAADSVERQSCRPDFAVGLATWHWRKKESPFVFRKDTPPIFLVHATNDGIDGGAPIELPQAIAADLKKIGVPVQLRVFDEGGHGVGNLIPQRVAHGFPPAQWPQLLLQWLDVVLGPAASAKP